MTLSLHRGTARIIIFILIIACTGYALFEARRLIRGPVLTITSPKDGSTVAGPLMRITGEARNISFLSVDGQQSYTDADGHFSAHIAAPSGTAIIEVVGNDRFGRSITKMARVTVVAYCPLTA